MTASGPWPEWASDVVVGCSRLDYGGTRPLKTRNIRNVLLQHGRIESSRIAKLFKLSAPQARKYAMATRLASSIIANYFHRTPELVTKPKEPDPAFVAAFDAELCPTEEARQAAMEAGQRIMAPLVFEREDQPEGSPEVPPEVVQADTPSAAEDSLVVLPWGDDYFIDDRLAA